MIENKHAYGQQKYILLFIYGGKISNKRISDVAELNNDIVKNIVRIIGPDFIQVPKYACMLETINW